jgi:hypothetical protein
MKRGRMAGGVYTKQAKEEEEKEQKNYDIRIEFVKIQIQVGKKSHRFLEQCQPNIFGAVIHVGFPRKSCKNKKANPILDTFIFHDIAPKQRCHSFI